MKNQGPDSVVIDTITGSIIVSIVIGGVELELILDRGRFLDSPCTVEFGLLAPLGFGRIFIVQPESAAGSRHLGPRQDR
jgi:hypothetical protein